MYLIFCVEPQPNRAADVIVKAGSLRYKGLLLPSSASIVQTDENDGGYLTRCALKWTRGILVIELHMTENVEYIDPTARLDDLINRLIRIKTRLLQSSREVDSVQSQKGPSANVGTEQLNGELDVFSSELKKIEAALLLLSMQVNKP